MHHRVGRHLDGRHRRHRRRGPGSAPAARPQQQGDHPDVHGPDVSGACRRVAATLPGPREVHVRRLAWLLLVVGCAGSDLDGDGYAAPEDCDDSDPETHPDAREQCDDVDNDCDGQIDEPVALGGVERYLDEDGDGWGTKRKDLDDDGETESTTVVTCDPVTRYVERAGDCDDDDPKVFPGQGCP
ncbi:MAG: putative metal-binding motif-containing protein [Alphaproteobacteria bacterium]|nr:putative metal-binding motif-containing protein [Alphaproteobacteria bacterium]